MLQMRALQDGLVRFPIYNLGDPACAKLLPLALVCVRSCADSVVAVKHHQTKKMERPKCPVKT